MAYGTKFRFNFQSVNGADSRIDVLLDGYTGEPIVRRLGQAPVLKRQENDRILGTSLEFWAECEVDGEFAEFYTSNPNAYRVDLFRANAVVWSGFLSPEIYSEPDVVPPYDVDIVATDGIGELKLYDFQPQGLVSLRSLLEYLLGRTGIDTAIAAVSELCSTAHSSPVSASAFLDEVSINLDYKEGDTCYEVLQYLLTSLCAKLTYERSYWWLVRETDMTVGANGISYYDGDNEEALTLSGSVKALGSMDSADLWPISYTKTSIEPAKKKVVVQSPLHPGKGLINPDMQTNTGWTLSGTATYNASEKCYKTGSDGAISQTLQNVSMCYPFSLVMKYGLTSVPSGINLFYVGGLQVRFTTIQGAEFSLAYENNSFVWKNNTSQFVIDPGRSLTASEDRSDASEYDVTVPGKYNDDGIVALGTLTITIVSPYTNVYGCSLSVDAGTGYQDIMNLGNGARGDAKEVEVAGGRMKGSVLLVPEFLDGIFKKYSLPISLFSDKNFTNKRYLDLITRDYALGVALPRLKVDGTVNTPASLLWAPFVVSRDNVDYALGEYSWDLYNDEMEVSLLSLPAATLTVQSESFAPANIEQS